MLHLNMAAAPGARHGARQLPGPSGIRLLVSQEKLGIWIFGSVS